MDINFSYRLKSIIVIAYFVAQIIPDLAIGSSFKLSTFLKVNTFYCNWLGPFLLSLKLFLYHILLMPGSVVMPMGILGIWWRGNWVEEIIYLSHLLRYNFVVWDHFHFHG